MKKTKKKDLLDNKYIINYLLIFNLNNYNLIKIYNNIYNIFLNQIF